MKEMLERICCKQVVFTSLEVVDPKVVLHTRKKLAIFSGVDPKSFYHLIFRIEQKSRFLRKHVDEMAELCKTLELHVKHTYKYKHLLLNAPLCSKAAIMLQENGWKVYNDFM
ncbi:PQQ-like domain-containing protein [Sulfurospirillum multivorans DSM 12446]|uniref:PQQ-like domain-containing protein n=3 Tax=Sulfurospirillum multivorans TaxID=66821 RepID=A0AA86AK58_SULMK|nr:PQQ-like domain-containing protein [Sulfurospirillum multivorans DSM 12446]QEH05534.1 PQQ-like domain-containing protein [Sulfurospirillum multivorans]